MNLKKKHNKIFEELCSSKAGKKNKVSFGSLNSLSKGFVHSSLKLVTVI